MIARVFIWIILLIILPDIYLYRRLRGKRPEMGPGMKMLWWLPAAILLVYTVALAMTENFAPKNMIWLRIYLALSGLLLMPKAVFCLCSFIGWAIRRSTGATFNYGTLVGDVLSLGCVLLFFYGLLYGWRGLTVKHADITVNNLPAAFDGYRITLFSDWHLGSFTGKAEKLAERDADSINAQKSNLIVFTGDLQNMQPAELIPFRKTMASLKAPDGVFSVLGNHDYTAYIDPDTPEAQKRKNERLTQTAERQAGWHLLINTNCVIKHGSDSIFIAGGECADKKKERDRDNIAATARNIPKGAFVINLQHNPGAWDSTRVSRLAPQITLSGHTHGGQMSVCGLRPTMLQYDYDYGLYERDGKFIYVTGGLGGLISFRINMEPEIVVITLHRAK